MSVTAREIRAVLQVGVLDLSLTDPVRLLPTGAVREFRRGTAGGRSAGGSPGGTTGLRWSRD